MKHTAVTRYIMTGSNFCWGYVVANGHYGHSMHFFAAVMKMVREDFPDTHFDDDAFDVFRVSKSSRIEGMWGLMFKLPEGATHQDYQTVTQLPFYIQ